MTDREALFRAILENPDDNTLRLIYADALEEEGDVRRAAFVRAQVGLAGLPDHDPIRIRARFHDRETTFATRWIQELPQLPEGLQWSRDPFRRGFPAAILAADATAFVNHADELFARFPIENLELSVVRLAEVREFAECHWLSRLIRLSVAQGLSGHAANRLLGSRRYERLRELHVGAGLTTAATATAVVHSRVFQQLTTLSCRDDRGGGRTLVRELSQLADPPRLRALDLSGNRLTAEQLTRLLAAPALSTVENLDLSDNNLGADAVSAIASAALPHLRSLHLRLTRPEAEGIRALMQAGFLSGLRILSLGGNNLPPTVADLLAGTPTLASLRVLDLRTNRLGDEGAIALADGPHLRGLLHLDLAENLIEDAGADSMSESAGRDELIFLDLSANVISPPAATRLKRRFGDRVLV